MERDGYIDMILIYMDIYRFISIYLYFMIIYGILDDSFEYLWIYMEYYMDMISIYIYIY